MEDPSEHLTRKLFLSKIHIKVKFDCSLFLESSLLKHSRTKEVKIEPATHNYVLEEIVEWDNAKPSTVFIKLVSSKGVTFTAGVATLGLADLSSSSAPFRVAFAKALDPETYLECQWLTDLNTDPVLPASTGDSNIKIRELKLQDQNTKVSHDLHILEARGEMGKGLGDQEQVFQRQQIPNSNPLFNKVDSLEAEEIRGRGRMDYSHQIVRLLEKSQEAFCEEKKELKAALRLCQQDLEQKRIRIRELETEKVQLIMSNVATEKEIIFMRERVLERLASTHRLARRLLPCRHLTKPVHQGQLYTDETLKLGLNSSVSLCAINDISISNIRVRKKEDVSLLSSELFVKGSNLKQPSTELIREIAEAVRSSCSSIETLLTNFQQEYRRQLSDSRNRQYRLISQNGHLESQNKLLWSENEHLRCDNGQFQRSEESLLWHLQELSGGLEAEVAAGTVRQSVLRHLQMQLAEKGRALEALQQERAVLKQELCQLRFQLAQRDEQDKDQSLPTSLPIVPKVSPRKPPKFNPHTYNFQQYSPQILELKQTLRILELELVHCQQQQRQLEESLKAAEEGRRSAEDLLRRERGARGSWRQVVLNESIQFQSSMGEE